MFAQHSAEPVGRTLGIGGDRGVTAGFAFAVEVIAHRVEQVEIGIGALGGEILRRPRPGIE